MEIGTHSNQSITPWRQREDKVSMQANLKPTTALYGGSMLLSTYHQCLYDCHTNCIAEAPCMTVSAQACSNGRRPSSNLCRHHHRRVICCTVFSRVLPPFGAGCSDPSIFWVVFLLGTEGGPPPPHTAQQKTIPALFSTGAFSFRVFFSRGLQMCFHHPLRRIKFWICLSSISGLPLGHGWLLHGILSDWNLSDNPSPSC